jgi:hypothetical protein
LQQQVGLCSESDRDLTSTRGAFLTALAKAAPEFGLKPNTKTIPRSLFEEVMKASTHRQTLMMMMILESSFVSKSYLTKKMEYLLHHSLLLLLFFRILILIVQGVGALAERGGSIPRNLLEQAHRRYAPQVRWKRKVKGLFRPMRLR